ncbi:MAG: cell division protein FtsZ [Alphaproteobacteria bacterium]|nr:cell division protein FtsZ [Alphaproteobacteria bacterium]
MDKTESIVIKESELTIGLATPPPKVLLTPNLGVIGVGGAGGNAVNNMVASNLTGCAFFVANTDAQALSKSLVADRIQLGEKTTMGLGAGSNPEIGRQSAEESAEKIKEAIDGLHLLFLTAGMGGGTGTGAIPVIAKLAKEKGILTVGVVSTPFNFEGPHRMQVAKKGIAELQQYVDTLIIVPNQNLFRIAQAGMTFAKAFKISDDVLCQGVRSITDLVMNPGMVNLDFADVRTVLTTMGRAMMGTGKASGENRAELAADQALTNPLLDDASIQGAKSVLINISGGLDLTLEEVDIIMQKIVSQVDENANVKFGSTVNEELEGSVQVSIVATGLGEPVQKVVVQPQPKPQPEPGVEGIRFTKTELILKHSETVPEKETTEPDSNLFPNEFEFSPVLKRQDSSVPSELEMESSETEVTVPKSLFNDEPPSVEPTVPVKEVPKEKPEINLSSQKETANVKRPVDLFSLIPGLIGRGKNAPKPKDTMKKETSEETTSNEPMDLPSFLRQR